MMEKIQIFADSASDIPHALCEQYGIEIVPITIHCGAQSYREYFDITAEEYWKMIEQEETIPTTSQTSIPDLLALYTKAKERGVTHVLGVLLSSHGSGSYQAACMARDMFYEEHGECMHIELIDSEVYSMIFGQVVLSAAQMQQDGETFSAICELVRSRLLRCEAVLGVYTLKYLKKSGRVSGAAAFIGEALGLRPLTLITAGKVDVVGKVRGDKNVVSGIANMVGERVQGASHQTAYLMYGDVEEAKIAELEQLLKTNCGFASVERYPLGPSIVTNAGPNVLAVVYYGVAREH